MRIRLSPVRAAPDNTWWSAWVCGDPILAIAPKGDGSRPRVRKRPRPVDERRATVAAAGEGLPNFGASASSSG